MKERPILFNAAMVRAIIEGQKTKTRREVKLRDLLKIRRGDATHYKGVSPDAAIKRCITDVGMDGLLKLCPYGQLGDQLWVRETWAEVGTVDPGFITYKATYPKCLPQGMQNVPKDLHEAGYKWRPSIHMPRWASRIQLEITGIRVERLQDISEGDAIAEGIKICPNMNGRVGKAGYVWPNSEYDRAGFCHSMASTAFFEGWRLINGLDTRNPNPWVWVIEFRRIT